MATNSGSNRNANQGTGFVDYNKILNANQGSGERMGQAIAGGLESQANAVQGQLGQQKDEFDQGLNTAQSGWNDASNDAKQLAAGDVNNIGSTYGNQDLTNVGNNFRNYGYTGPTGLKNSTGLQNQAATASALGQLAGNTQGQQQLLKNYASNGGNYTQGQNAFDQALLAKYGQAPINQAKQGLTGINNQVNTAVSGAENQANQFKHQIGDERTDLSKKIGNVLGESGSYNDNTGLNTGGKGILGDVTNQAGKYKQNATQIQTILDDVSKGDTTQLQSDIAAGKIDPSLLSHLSDYGLDPTQQLYQKEGSAYNRGRIGDLLGLYRDSGNSITGAGNQLYQGQQQAAARALAQFLGDNRLSNINSNTFDTKVFDPTTHNNATLYNNYKDVVKSGGTEQAKDIQAEQNITNYGLASRPLLNNEIGSLGNAYNPLANQAANQYLYSPTSQSSEYLNPDVASSIVNGAWLPQSNGGSVQITPQQAQLWQAIQGHSPFVNHNNIVGKNVSLEDLLKKFTVPQTDPTGQTGPGRQIIPH